MKQSDLFNLKSELELVGRTLALPSSKEVFGSDFACALQAVLLKQKKKHK